MTLPRSQPVTEEMLAAERYEAGMYKCLYELWEKRATEYQAVIIDLTEAMQARAAPARCDLESEEGLTDCAEHMLLQARPAEGGDWINIYAAQLQGLARSGGYDFRALVPPPSEAGRARAEVVAAVQQAIMKHPHWEPGLGSSAFAFGLANTAIDAYTRALSPDPGTVA